jgi:hypothetical protein
MGDLGNIPFRLDTLFLLAYIPRELENSPGDRGPG